MMPVQNMIMHNLRVIDRSTKTAFYLSHILRVIFCKMVLKMPQKSRHINVTLLREQ